MRVVSILPVLILLAMAGMANAQGAYVNYDFPGKDYKSFNMDKDYWPDCQNACGNDPKCNAWTYVKPGYQGPKGRCYLKSAGPKWVSNECCVSGHFCRKPTFATTSPLPSVVVGGDYSCQLKMSSGVTPYKFYPMQVPPDGTPPRVDNSRDQRFSMPLGLKLSPDGLISGQVQSDQAGYIPLLIQVRDSCPGDPQVITKKFFINIKQQP
jgi:hypothetical protein